MKTQISKLKESIQTVIKKKYFLHLMLPEPYIEISDREAFPIVFPFSAALGYNAFCPQVSRILSNEHI